MNSPMPANNPPFDLSGQTLGNYRLLHRLGRGGMADVYLAEQSSLGRQVAVKVLRRELASQAEYVKRFHNEARAVASLVHANIVQIYEVGCEQGVHFIAQEYVPGQNLKQLVSRNGALDFRRAISVVRQIAAALNKASQRNIVHRDIKPENILLTPAGEAKVADFGLARVMDPQRNDLTQAGLTMGTPLYMSPEQVEGRPLDARSDLYSCGATLFFMLVGRPPFQGETPLAVAVQHLQNPPPDLAQLRPDVPTELRAIVQRLLAKKPDERYPNAAELIRDLRQIAADIPGTELPSGDSAIWSGIGSPATMLEATQQLQAVMATQQLVAQRRPKLWPSLVAIGAAIVCGAAAAQLTWNGPLMRVEELASNGVEKRSDVREQYWYAIAEGTEEAYKSVAKFYPPDPKQLRNEYFINLAEYQLALFYLNHNQYINALTTFQKLASLPPTEPQMRAIGLAGEVITYDRMKADKEVQRLLPAAMTAQLDLKDDELKSLLEEIFKRYEQRVSAAEST
ncbi:MAG: serine/threonine protein kinase [Planctomycetales bacterium]|nr:serine/threonine protein kinase [Planctomycetales bacterium]